MKPIVVRVVFFLVSYCTIVASSVAAMDLQRKFAKSLCESECQYRGYLLYQNGTHTDTRIDRFISPCYAL